MTIRPGHECAHEACGVVCDVQIFVRRQADWIPPKPPGAKAMGKMSDAGLTTAEIAEQCGVPPWWVALHMSLLPPPVYLELERIVNSGEQVGCRVLMRRFDQPYHTVRRAVERFRRSRDARG